MKRIAALLISCLFITSALLSQRTRPSIAANADLFVYLPSVHNAPPPTYKLAYLLDSNSEQQLIVAESDGSDPILRASSASPSFDSPTWSSTGLKLAFGMPAPEYQLWQVGHESGMPSVIVYALNDLGSGVTLESRYAWSPDDRQIAFATSGNLIDIIVADLRTDTVANITQDSPSNARDNHDPHWSPLGADIVFANRNLVDDTIYGAIELIAPNGANRHPIYGPFANQQQHMPTFSPDGGQIAFIDMAAPFSAESGELVIIDANGSNPSRYPAPFPIPAGGLHWSPDGTQIAFIGQDDNGTVRASAVRLADGSVRQSLLPADANSWVTWAANNQAIIFDAPESDISIRNLYQHNLDNGLTLPLTSGEAGDQYRQPTMSPNPTP